MKIQDIAFFLVFAFLLYKRDARLFAFTGILFLIGSIPLFVSWIFFTAERLVWYGALCFFSSGILLMFSQEKKKAEKS